MSQSVQRATGEPHPMHMPENVVHHKVVSTVRLVCAAALGIIAIGLTMGITGCYAADSARADYYTSRAIQAQARDGDGSIIIVNDREDLRQALLRAKRIQLAGADAEK